MEQIYIGNADTIKTTLIWKRFLISTLFHIFITDALCEEKQSCGKFIFSTFYILSRESFFLACLWEYADIQQMQEIKYWTYKLISLVPPTLVLLLLLFILCLLSSPTPGPDFSQPRPASDTVYWPPIHNFWIQISPQISCSYFDQNPDQLFQYCIFRPPHP